MSKRNKNNLKRELNRNTEELIDTGAKLLGLAAKQAFLLLIDHTESTTKRRRSNGRKKASKRNTRR